MYLLLMPAQQGKKAASGHKVNNPVPKNSFYINTGFGNFFPVRTRVNTVVPWYLWGMVLGPPADA